MKQVGITGSGTVLVELGERELRGIKALADGLAEIAAGLPPAEDAEGNAKPAKIHPPRHRKARIEQKNAKAAKPRPPSAARKVKICRTCKGPFNPRTSEKDCPKCRGLAPAAAPAAAAAQAESAEAKAKRLEQIRLLNRKLDGEG
jgi:hypothetical protein